MFGRTRFIADRGCQRVLALVCLACSPDCIQTVDRRYLIFTAPHPCVGAYQGLGGPS
ncbi:hypothetical protein PF005_g9320 [Phytophthora fragariae]|uniref:Uncharacterized protein n=1 Tax=Phytophthora fragariae TaxID=53985 RepID=A0A6A3TXI6_9STRA|nr:hypothetical protein PF003_g12184 [Phytophthora fragariae]KAE8939865.1 hypothetical protein PF009_g10310 [Phytophthora fragariae]KAE9117139.1 hypothetical protein PF007_g9403 [Phytophthora fragariae]KAE9143847.1 hypothetical protein PF006_g11166 [Phytophthora fragariae]KAE9214693.1 hypothetical protein PF002_g17594 [Phytophthora fragariae]